jgi:alkylation response protein AidB-like acyl-CoA dehydrogenase
MLRISAAAAASIPDMTTPLERARQLAEVAHAHADQAEEERRLPAPFVDALLASGLGRLLAPTALGGWAAPATTVVEVVETIAAADPSAGWCVGIGLGSNFLAGYLPRDGATELFVDLDRPGAGVFAPTGRGVMAPGGYCLSGRWAFASGCQHAAVQASGMIVVADGGQPELDPSGAPIQRLALVPTAAVSVEETWDTVGMRGTGSHDTAVRDQFVPREHTLVFTDPTWTDDPLFQQSPFAVLGPCLGAVPLGLGRAALDAVEAQVQAAHAAPKPGPKTPFGDDAMAQYELGRAEVRLRSVRALLLDTLDDAHQTTLAGNDPSPSAVALIGLICQEAMTAAVHAVDVASRIAGSSSVRAHSRLERLQRDIHTMRQHVLFSPAVGASLGRQLAGIDTIAPPFLLPRAA